MKNANDKENFIALRAEGRSFAVGCVGDAQ